MQASNTEMREHFAKRPKNELKVFEKKQTRSMRTQRRNRHVFED